MQAELHNTKHINNNTAAAYELAWTEKQTCVEHQTAVSPSARSAHLSSDMNEFNEFLPRTNKLLFSDVKMYFLVPSATLLHDYAFSLKLPEDCSNLGWVAVPYLLNLVHNFYLSVSVS